MKLKFNCYHYDIARGAYLRPEFFKKAMRLAADSGFTHFLPYLENMIRLPSMERACPDSAYTAEQWRDFEKAADEYGIELMPHFNVIGHTKQICEVYPEMVGRKGDIEIDVTSKAVKDWTVNCLGEFCSFSDGKYFLIGGDEWQAPDHLLAKEGFNVARAWAEQVNMAVEFLVSKGRIPIVWHDMLVHYPEAMKLLSKDAVIAFWFYDEDSDYAVMDSFKRLGFQVIMASGLCCGLVTGRRLRAVESAVESMERHHVDMFMMTSWENACWERETAAIPIIGGKLRNEELPTAVVKSLSVYELVERNPDSVLVPDLRRELDELMEAPAWSGYPELHSFVNNMLKHDYKKVVESFERFHFAEGPIHERLKALQNANPPAKKDAPSRPPALPKGGAFEIAVRKDAAKGEWITLVNNDESLELFPKYGGVLQNWRCGDETIIPESVDARLRRGKIFEKGGYRSYSALGGLRPIWALGTHHNPCILWQYPYDWKIVKDGAEMKAVELSREFYHVGITLRISIRKGQSGFSYFIRAVNKLEFTYGAFNFNLPISFCDKEIPTTSLEWVEGGKLHVLPFKDVRRSFFVVNSGRALRVRKEKYLLDIDCGEAGAAGFYVDWSGTYITPDLHGIYKPLKRGDVRETTWTFSLVRPA